MSGGTKAYWIVIGIVLLAFIYLAFTGDARPHYRPGFHNQQHAVVWGFCRGDGSLRSPCRYGREALVVASLESHTAWVRGRCHEASNGQYRGCFQMGEGERSRWGHGNNPWVQARAAFRYFEYTGSDWSPWSCKPWGRCYY